MNKDDLALETELYNDIEQAENNKDNAIAELDEVKDKLKDLKTSGKIVDNVRRYTLKNEIKDKKILLTEQKNKLKALIYLKSDADKVIRSFRHWVNKKTRNCKTGDKATRIWHFNPTYYQIKMRRDSRTKSYIGRVEPETTMLTLMAMIRIGVYEQLIEAYHIVTTKCDCSCWKPHIILNITYSAWNSETIEITCRIDGYFMGNNHDDVSAEKSI